MSGNTQRHWGAPADDFLFPAELQSIAQIRETIGFDVLKSHQFWEFIIARMLGGNTTPHKAEHDIELEMGGETYCAEVKFATGNLCRFSPIRGKETSREIFKWGMPLGRGGKLRAIGIILVGRSMSDLFYSWVIPREMFALGCASITVTCPESRVTDSYRWDRFAVPFDQILPAFLRIIKGTPMPLFEHPRVLARRRMLDKTAQLRFETQIFGPSGGEA